MNIRGFFTKKKIIVGVIALVVLAGVGLYIKSKNSSPTNVLTDTVKKQDLKQTVLATGQVTSTTDLNLSFKVSGVVSRVNTKVGAKVKNGQVIANLEQRDQAAALTSARGALAAAQANYDRVLAGASSEEVQLAQTTLDNAKKTLADTIKQQSTLVANAKSNLLNTTFSAIPYNSSTTSTLSVSGYYSGSDMGNYVVSIYLSGNGYMFRVGGLETDSGIVNTGIPTPIGTKGLYVTFPSGITSIDAWKIEIPNTQASTYTTNNNAYKAALETQTVAISSAEAAVSSAEVFSVISVQRLELCTTPAWS
jgi:multidrug efflux pump subunit AcrA (membrane-fusion protein)